MRRRMLLSLYKNLRMLTAWVSEKRYLDGFCVGVGDSMYDFFGLRCWLAELGDAV